MTAVPRPGRRRGGHGHAPENVAAAAALEALADVEGAILVVCDFDGTLAAIDPDPAGAMLHPEARRALRHLGRIARARPDRLALAILSGRTALDVAGRVRIGGVTYLGDHGLQGGVLPPRVPAERLPVVHAGDGNDPHAHDAHAGHAAASRRLGDEVGRLLADADWLYVEPKGPSVAFHYRTADDPAAARDRILAALGAARASLPADLRGPRFDQLETWRIVEVRPEGAGAKGAAVEDLVVRHRAAAVAVLGDDRTDAEAFRAVAAARASGRLAAAVAIGVRRGAATPAEVTRAADVLLPGPEATGAVLRALAHRLDAETRGA
jgi:trehalose 6-phosphate phosphatase